VLERSLWTYETSAAGGLNIGALSMSGGQVILKNPRGELHRFRYHGFGPGLGMGARAAKSIRLPDLKFPKGQSGSASGSTTDFPGRGWIYRAKPSELTPHDFEGITLYADASAGFLIAEGLTGLIVGLSEKAFIPLIFSPALFSHAISASAKALVLLQGQSEGLIDGAGVGLMIGQLTYVGPY
jgi:hypothetical protein